ncbi:MAG: hypothetical protein PHW11_06765 [Anaerolineaceae bacterium]|jgi:uncharacterized membrane protein|nr:hypothetical protein [Anaerolineaceae bacterium]MDD4042328.1 hypothetical protein [Anaerolineaceae bacterium]
MKFTDRDVLIDPCNNLDRIKDYGFPHTQIRGGLTLTLIGLLVLILGLRPDIFGLDRGLYIGFSQIITILIGIALLTVGASSTLNSFWACTSKSLLADIGGRTIMTGYVICAFTALADAFGFGTNPPPEVILGTLQSYGVIIGLLVILTGLLMTIRWSTDRGVPLEPTEQMTVD